RTHVEGKAVDQTAFPSIAETNILKMDIAACDCEDTRIRPVGERMRARDREHAFLHHADILEYGRDLIGDPVRDADDLRHHRQRHCHDADLNTAKSPKHDRKATSGSNK